MNVIIIEDEKLSAEHLTTMLHRIDKSITVVNTYDTVKASVHAFQSGIQADLLFVDIHLADGISFEIFAQVLVEVPIIFTTAYDDYAIRAFKLNSVDYLLKPIGIDELTAALEKFKKYKMQFQSTLSENISLTYQHFSAQTKNRFIVRSGQNIDSILTEQVFHFQTQDSITFLVIENGKRFPVNYTMEQLESLLAPEQFFRINRKVLLNIKAIDRVSAYVNSRLLVQSKHLGGDMAVVSRERVADFKVWLDS
ncbi:MAG: response regulator transcription factor [Chitinophagaceae bacterium]|nr:response regulator transcription factor [Chitinophagaceae bacterium]